MPDKASKGKKTSAEAKKGPIIRVRTKMKGKRTRGWEQRIKIQTATSPEGVSSVEFKGILILPQPHRDSKKYYTMLTVGSQTVPTTEHFWIGW